MCRGLRRSLLVLAVVLVAAAPCQPVGPPTGRWTYHVPFGPLPSTSIQVNGALIVVSDFAGDRALSSTMSRYDAKALNLLSAEQHASCCGGEWSATVTRGADGYDVVAKRFAQTAPGKRKETTSHVRLPLTDRPVIVNAMALLPWTYHMTHARFVESISLPDASIDSIGSQTLAIVDVADSATPASLPVRDRALRVTRESGDATVLWYDPCTFLVDAFESRTSLVVRSDLIK